VAIGVPDHIVRVDDGHRGGRSLPATSAMAIAVLMAIVADDDGHHSGCLDGHH